MRRDTAADIVEILLDATIRITRQSRSYHMTDDMIKTEAITEAASFFVGEPMNDYRTQQLKLLQELQSNINKKK